MRMNQVKIKGTDRDRGMVNCPTCRNDVTNLYELDNRADTGIVGSEMCGECMCDFLSKREFDIKSNKKMRNTECSDAICPECKSREVIVYIDNRNPLEIGTYFVRATCGHCGREYRVGLDTFDGAFAEYDEDTGLLRIVPLDDCMIEVIWSHEHERLVGVVRDIPVRD